MGLNYALIADTEDDGYFKFLNLKLFFYTK